MAVLDMVLAALWAILPAYMANMGATVTGGGPPIDGGRTLSDGGRLLGDGKTWRGLIGGTLLAAATGWALHLIAPTGLGFDLPLTDFAGPNLAIVHGAALGFGALFGDAAASFFKRRKGHERGDRWPGFDQLDFIAGALVITALVSLLLAPWGSWAWFLATFTWQALLVLLVLTPLLHIAVNHIAYWLRIKDVPW